MMKRSFRDAWVAKLRSGEIKQATGYLCTLDGARCCLGVAYLIDNANAEIANLRYEDADEWEKKDMDDYPGNYPGLSFDSAKELPTDEHLNQWGLSSDVTNDLANRNDGICEYIDNKHSFNEIADIIEQMPVEEG